MTFTTAAAYKWDTKKFKEDNPKDALLTENYKLMIHDSDGAFDDAAEAGYLAPFSGFQFGLYEPHPYVSIEDGWQCGVCSGAGSLMGDVERRAVGGAVITSVITVLTFTWFVAGFGVQCQVVVPQGAMARLGDAVEAVAAPVMQRRAQFRLAGRDAQQQCFSSRVMAPQVEQRRADHITAQFAGSDTHTSLQ